MTYIFTNEDNYWLFIELKAGKHDSAPRLEKYKDMLFHRDDAARQDGDPD